ncbi:MAG TPA: hypothetical protein VM510_12375 [Caulifigura sp.]|nr:hypothetical protein [Caulifigura sp.]
MNSSAQAVEALVAINCLVVGLSHLPRPRGWVAFFHWLRDRGVAGAFVNGLLSLSFGSLIVAFHPVWSGWPLVVTLFGCTQVFKGMVCLVLPDVALRSLSRVDVTRAHEFRAAGVVLIVLGLAAAACWWSSTP